MWCIPEKPSAEFVFHMEDVLEVYHRPYDPKRPVVCVDETFKQLIGETRQPLPMRPGTVERFDYVYTRNGVASLFLACEPLAGWRHLAVTDHRCRSDWAVFIRALLEGRYRDAEKLVLVMDQLNTHSPASLYEAFPPEEAKRLADRLEIHHTPKHGSWLNMAEIELSVLARQCLSRRTAHQDTLKRQIASWEERRNAARPQIKWQFTTQDARIKLRSLYPSVHARQRTSDVWADTAYRSKANERHLADNGLRSRIHRKKPKGKPMPAPMARANGRKSKVRAAVEHVFAHQKGPMGLVVRTIGLARARVKIGLANLVFNMKRMIWLTRPLAAA
jgi:IS5 family transposase